MGCQSRPVDDAGAGLKRDRDSAIRLALDLARQREDGATRTLARAAGDLRQAEVTLGTLHRYSADYATRWRKQTVDTAIAHTNFHRFLGKLDEAVGAQAAETSQRERNAAQARDSWQDAHRKVRSLELLLEKRLDATQRRQERQAQKLNDEFAARSARSRSSDTTGTS